MVSVGLVLPSTEPSYGDPLFAGQGVPDSKGVSVSAGPQDRRISVSSPSKLTAENKAAETSCTTVLVNGGKQSSILRRCTQQKW